MVRFFNGLLAGLIVAYLTAPQRGKSMRAKIVDFTNDELRGIRLITQQWTKTVSRAQQAWEAVKATAGFLSTSPKPRTS